jgi:hypothetical protein
MDTPVGVASCMTGVIFNVLQDYKDDTDTGNDDAIVGPISQAKRRSSIHYCILLFGANNVLGGCKVTML